MASSSGLGEVSVEGVFWEVDPGWELGEVMGWGEKEQGERRKF